MPKFITYKRPGPPRGKGLPNARFGAPIPGRKEPRTPKGPPAPGKSPGLPPKKD